MKHPKTHITAGVMLAALALAPGASAATTATGSQAVTGTPTAQLAATFPSDYAFGTFVVGGSGNTSSEQLVNVKSNASWGVKISTDDATGNMREWDGTGYVGSGYALGSALQWALTSVGGSAVGSPSYANLSSGTTSVVTGQARTGDSGVDVGARLKQFVSYADQASLTAGHTYRVSVLYTAQQGF